MQEQLCTICSLYVRTVSSEVSFGYAWKSIIWSFLCFANDDRSLKILGSLHFIDSFAFHFGCFTRQKLLKNRSERQGLYKTRAEDQRFWVNGFQNRGQLGKQCVPAELEHSFLTLSDEAIFPMKIVTKLWKVIRIVYISFWKTQIGWTVGYFQCMNQNIAQMDFQGSRWQFFETRWKRPPDLISTYLRNFFEDWASFDELMTKL